MAAFYKTIRTCSAMVVMLAGSSSLVFSDPVILDRPLPATQPHAPDAKPQDAWVLNFKDTDIQTVIRQIAEMTGENYVIPSTVGGKVNVISQTPLNRKEIRELLLSVLYVNGLTLVSSGNSLVIQPSADARKNKTLVDKSGKIDGEAFITRVIPLKYTSANELLEALQPMVSDFAVVRNLPDANAILVADKADNVQKIAEIVAQLDTPEDSGIETVRLQKSWVGNVMPLLEKIAPREVSESGKPTSSPIRIVGDEHSNTVILKGKSDVRARLHAMISQLDQASDDGTSVQVISLRNADAAKTADLLKDMFTNAGAGAAAVPNTIPVSIKASVAGNALVVHASPDVIDQIRKVVAQIDVQRPQVLIEAAIVEVDDDLLGQLGIQFGAGQKFFQSNLLTTSLSPATSGALAPANNSLASLVQGLNLPNSTLIGGGLTGVFSNSSKFTALVQALAANTHANLLSTPSITTLNNEEAKILVGQNVPFLTGSYSLGTTSGSTVNPFNTIQRQDIGVTLKVTPQIHEGKQVLLKVDQEVSSISPTTVSGASDIITNKRSIDTNILAFNGQTVALGGLITNNKNSSKSEVPILGDLPLIGYLFQSNSEENVKSDLIVFLRPTIIDSQEEVTAVNLRKYNDVWTFEMGATVAKDNPLTPDKMHTEINNLYTPDMNNQPTLPWLIPAAQK